MINDSNNKCYQSIDGDASGLYPEKRGSSPLDSSCLNCYKETSNPKFCSKSCSATYNNKKFPKRKSDRYFKKCFFCDKKTKNPKFCSLNCFHSSLRNDTVQKWKDGSDSGLTAIGIVKPAIKKYLIDRRGNYCEICGWCEINPYTKKVPIVADHIDGNYLNNVEENLRLLCPNCDSLQSTYKGLNAGNGRGWRRKTD